MPYIKQEDRAVLEDIIHLMIDAELHKANGSLNYVLFYICKNFVAPSYSNYKNFLGELREAEHEIRRRLLVPYEEEKRKENGDVE